MLSDEEKKSIDDLFALTHINGYIDLYKQHQARIYTSDLSKWQNGVKTLLNLIEKQSKEIEELKENMRKRDYISKKKLYKHIEMLEKENCHETCTVKKLINCESQCSIGCTIKNIKKILEG